MNYEITLTDEAKAYLISLDGKTRTTIGRKIEALKESPEKQGKGLSGDLIGYRSLHAAGRKSLKDHKQKDGRGKRLAELG